MHYSAKIAEGESDCEMCGYYTWEEISVFDSEGNLVINVSGNDHTGEYDSAWFHLEDKEWKEIFNTFGHTIDIQRNEV